jgi:hypothetical protein
LEWASAEAWAWAAEGADDRHLFGVDLRVDQQFLGQIHRALDLWGGVGAVPLVVDAHEHRRGFRGEDPVEAAAGPGGKAPGCRLGGGSPSTGQTPQQPLSLPGIGRQAEASQGIAPEVGVEERHRQAEEGRQKEG